MAFSARLHRSQYQTLTSTWLAIDGIHDQPPVMAATVHGRQYLQSANWCSPDHAAVFATCTQRVLLTEASGLRLAQCAIYADGRYWFLRRCLTWRWVPHAAGYPHRDHSITSHSAALAAAFTALDLSDSIRLS